MATRTGVKSSQAQLIDLTTDDEDETPLQTNLPQLTSETALQLIDDLPPSNNGLILPGTFNWERLPTTELTVMRGDINLPKRPAVQTTRKYPPILPPPSMLHANKSNRQSTEHPFASLSPGNTAKRRKTEGDFVPQTRRAENGSSGQNLEQQAPLPAQRPSKPVPEVITPPGWNASAYQRTNLNGNRPASGSVQHDTLQECRPPSSGVKSKAPSLCPSTMTPKTTTVRLSPVPAPTSENKQRRISADGRIQKSKNKDAERMDHVLRHQGFPHMKKAMAMFNGVFSKDTQEKIWRKAVSAVINEPKFFQNYKSTHWELSSAVEQELASKATDYINSGGAQANLALPFEEFSNAILSTENGPMNSSSSSDADEVFESRSAIGKKLPVNRHDSFSPTTSSSTFEETNMVDIDRGNGLSRTSKARHSRGSLKSRTESPRISKSKAIDLAPKLTSHQKQGPRRDVVDSQASGLRKNNVSRPYRRFKDQDDIRRGVEFTNAGSRSGVRGINHYTMDGSAYHVDFSAEELGLICTIVQTINKNLRLSHESDMRLRLIGLIRGQQYIIKDLISVLSATEVGHKLLRYRSAAAVEAFLQDAVEDRIVNEPRSQQLRAAPKASRPIHPSISSLLRQREIYGLRPVRVSKGQQPLKFEMTSHLEDTFVRKSEWTDCAGDITTICWTGHNTYVCGATAHSDHHNMQYNKPGNIAVGSVTLDTLRSVPNHRVQRPWIEKSDNAENALDSMRQTQDPWLYTSVVSTSYCQRSGFTFSASFDHSVKIWNVSPDGTMDLCGAWYHDRNVNFVVTSDYHNRVATASQVFSNAIRVYNFDRGDITNSSYVTYSGERSEEQARETEKQDMWAYFPATIQWGKSEGVRDFLLVGYSPRSLRNDDTDIPEEKKNTGELCLWNVQTEEIIPIISAKLQNVFEVIWHPTQPIFVAATSPYGNFDSETRTQVRLFRQCVSGHFQIMTALDCRASDINELTIMPTNFKEAYVTASCTDGNTYMWDTAQGDDPIHTLGHGEPLDTPPVDALGQPIPREDADTGIKFAAWGKTLDRLYTGSSDGKVKAWDIRKPKGHAFVRTVLSISAGISAGAFSEDFSKLLIGDASGKVHILEVDDTDPNEAVPADSSLYNHCLGRESRRSTLPSRRPKVVIPHPQPDPPPGYEQHHEMSAQEMAYDLVQSGQLIIHDDPMIGAVQGPRYNETCFYRFDAHEQEDANMPLKPYYQAKQRFETQSQQQNLRLPRLPLIISPDPSRHAKNVALDFDFSQLSLQTQMELTRDDVDLDWDPIYDFEPVKPSKELFREDRQKRMHNF